MFLWFGFMCCGLVGFVWIVIAGRLFVVGLGILGVCGWYVAFDLRGSVWIVEFDALWIALC